MKKEKDIEPNARRFWVDYYGETDGADIFGDESGFYKYQRKAIMKLKLGETVVFKLDNGTDYDVRRVQ